MQDNDEEKESKEGKVEEGVEADGIAQLTRANAQQFKVELEVQWIG